MRSLRAYNLVRLSRKKAAFCFSAIHLLIRGLMCWPDRDSCIKRDGHCILGVLGERVHREFVELDTYDSYERGGGAIKFRR